MNSTTLKRIDATTWEIPRTDGMRVPGRIIANEELLKPILRDRAAEQVANVACLPGIVGYSMAMPDAHWGYGFPIGGVAATDPKEGGVISPGGVGYDINCGCRIMTTAIEYAAVKNRLHDIVAGLYRDIPSGVGSEGAIPKVDNREMRRVLDGGARWAVDRGYGTPDDLDATEDHGCIEVANADAVSPRALARGDNQVGTLGSGNHFVEVGVVERIIDTTVANAYGLREGFITVMIHSGSRGLGYQVCDDFIQTMLRAAQKYGIRLPDRQLCCAPVESPEGRQYIGAMSAAANYAWANRQVIMELVRRSITHMLRITPEQLEGRLLYDVCHNIAKMETHTVDGCPRRLCVHRKGATRSFPGTHPEVLKRYRGVGQPVLIPGDMGTGSYICAGTEAALQKTFGSCCHGAGRMLSRKAAGKTTDSSTLMRDLNEKEIVVMARSRRTLTEESPEAYKDIDSVAQVVAESGIGLRVARIRPVGVIKG